MSLESTKGLRQYFPLLAIILIAIVFRFWGIVSNPPSLNWDEVSHGYNAYSILKTGKDEWGETLPLIFRAYGDYKLPIFIYLTAVSELLFGLTPFAVRFVSAIAGVGTVVFTYFLTKEIINARLFLIKKDQKSIINKQSLAITSSLFVAVEPWSLFLSRGAFEANLALFFFVSGMYFFFKFLHSPSTHYSLLTTISLGLTVWTYNSYRIFTPLMLIVLIVIYCKELLHVFRTNIKITSSIIILYSLFLIPMFNQLFSSVGQARYSWVHILDQGTIAKIEEARNEGGSRLVHNKVTYFATNFTNNYISHFSPQFLLLEGGNNYQFSVPGKGILYIINLPFLLFGLLLLFKEALGKNKVAILILVWIILSPIPSSLTREAPHVLRTITMLPIPMLLSAFGLLKFIEFVRKYFPIYYIPHTIYFSLLAISIFGYLRDYFIDYRFKYSQSWQYGYEQVSQFIKENYSTYDKIIVTKKYGEPHEFLLFYLTIDPEEFRNDAALLRFYQSNWYWVDGFDKFHFVNDWEISEKSESGIDKSLSDENIFKLESGGTVSCHGTDAKCLLVTSPGNNPNSWQKLETINFLDGKVAFEIYEN